MKIKDIVNRDIVNLKNCDQEPIHIPGSIQPHGFLLGLNKQTCEVLFCSGNSEDFTGLTYTQLLGKPVSEIFGEAFAAELKECSELAIGVTKTFKVPFAGEELEFVVHQNDAHFIIECEAYENTPAQKNDFFDLSKEFLRYMEDTHSLKELCGLVADGIQKVTGYDRVMIYHFDKDYNGEVIAENKREDLESFLGLHYPHTDIPVQARELYIKNLLRIIVDVNYTPVPLYTIDDGVNKNLDLSYCGLRSVSPIHVQYLHNMGVGATLTISLIHKKKLWGLVACHHYSPKYLSHEVRLAARLQGHFITSQIDVRQLNEQYEESLKINEYANELISRIFEINRHSLELIIKDENLLRLCNASGASILVDGAVYKKGLTPSDKDIMELSVYLAEHTNHTHFYTDSLANTLSQFKPIAEKTPGIHYFSLDNNSPNCIIWYKPESISEVNWAGDPTKTIEKDAGGLSPRKSFELWKQTLKGESKPWLESEINTSSNFGNVLQKHLSTVFLAEEEEKQRELAQILTETNAELENINWISTHDLQEPLRKIQIMSSFILEDELDIPKEVYDKILGMNRSAERMQTLVKDILKYTRLNYGKEAFEKVDLNSIIHEVENEVADSLKTKNAVITVSELPVVDGVAFLIRQLFSNLIYNSLKFSDVSRTPQFKISSSVVSLESNPGSGNFSDYYRIVYSDNGIGFEKEFNESIFKIFTRLHPNTNQYAGSGVGLALCKKIMVTHRGFITANGREGEGADFYLYFPKV
jgi:chemotaxis family two-component system sensor kinase Cph1